MEKDSSAKSLRIFYVVSCNTMHDIKLKLEISEHHQQQYKLMANTMANCKPSEKNSKVPNIRSFMAFFLVLVLLFISTTVKQI